MFAVSLFVFESCEIRPTGFAQLGKAFPQSLHLCFVIARRRVIGIDTPLALNSLHHNMPSDFAERAVVDHQELSGDSHRQ